MFYTLMPFLYQTRTILRMPATRRTSARIIRSLHATAQRSKDSSIPFDYEIGPPGEASEVADRGTITPTERQVFERIFADIEARGLKPAIQDSDAPAAEPQPNRSARLILKQAAYDAGQSGPTTVVAPAILAGAAKDRSKALLRFPPSLRVAADKVLNTIKHQALNAQPSEDAQATNAAGAHEDDWRAPAHAFPRALELEAKRYPERTRIEGLITSAASDFELWDILEKEVFTMPARLGFAKNAVKSDDAQPSSNPRRQKRKSTKQTDESNIETTLKVSEEEDTASAASDNVSSPEDAQRLSLYVHGPLYPAYLLLALRRLDTAFSAPSPLAFCVLPRIKDLGLESYVLGVSTPFFNELIAIYWDRRGDLSGMLNLLEEMRHCGLYFDKQTASILNRVDTLVSGLANAKSRSGFGRALMLMPEYEQSQRERLRHWHRVVDLSVRERHHDLGYAGEATAVQ
ncbi:hypothetical protein F5Y01DRAFT_308086 [Xylaria sp. FL0043]|nr:hypothetical protein F5Y01DRAFT_308086 [Xylaria sp. FL0043]